MEEARCCDGEEPHLFFSPPPDKVCDGPLCRDTVRCWVMACPPPVLANGMPDDASSVG